MKKLSKRLWDKLFEYVPRTAVNILIKSPKGIVLSKRASPPYKEWWHVPGSFLIKGETFNEACKRIGKKELGIEIKVLKFLSVNETFKDPRGHVIDLNFLCRRVYGIFKPDKNTAEIKIFKETPKKIFPNHDKYFREALRVDYR